MEIMALVALGNFNDTFSEALKVDVDDAYMQMLGDKRLVR